MMYQTHFFKKGSKVFNQWPLIAPPKALNTAHRGLHSGSVRVNISIIVLYLYFQLKQPIPMTTSTAKNGLLKAILITGLVAGTLDILAAFGSAWLNSSTSPERVLQFVASGVFGMGAFSGGDAMILYGLVFHYAIATTWTAIFFIAAGKFKFLVSQKWLSGISYGLFVWLVMNLAVLPLSNAPKFPFNINSAMLGTLILIIAIGIPVSLMANRFYSKG